MSDTDLGNVFYCIVAKDTTSGGTASAAQNFFFMFNVIQEGVSMVQGAFDETVGSAMEFEQSMEHLSLTTDTSIGDVQRWREATVDMGVDFSAWSTSMTMMTQKIGAQGEAGDTLRAKIAALGVSVTDANGNYRSTSDIMQDLLPALSNVGDAQTRDADALAIFGRSWQNIAPMIDNGTAAVNAFKEASPVMSDEDAQKVQNFRIEWGIMSEKMEVFQADIGLGIIEWFQNIAQFGAEAGVEISSLGMAMAGLSQGISTGNWATLDNAMARMANPDAYAKNFLDTTTVALAKPTASTAGPVKTAAQTAAAQAKLDKLTSEQTSEGNAITNDQSQAAIDQAKLTHAQNTDKNTAGILLELQKLNQKIASDSAKYNTTTSTLTQLSRQQGVPLQ